MMIRTWFYFVFLGLALRAGLIYLTDMGGFADWKAYAYGLHFDIAVAGFFTLIWFIAPLLGSVKKSGHRRWVFLLTFIYTALFAGDYLYIKESGRHMGYEVLNLMSIQGSIGQLLSDYWKSLLICFFISWFFSSGSYRDIPAYGKFKKVFGLLIVLIIAFVGVRGIYSIPMDPSYAFRAGGAREANISLNSAYSILYSATSGRHVDKEVIPEPTTFNVVTTFEQWRKGRGIQKPSGNLKSNVIFVFLESWSTAHPWPHLAEFQKEGLSVELMLAGGHRTTEGLFATLCSFPNPLGKSIMFTQLESFDYRCLPQLLKEKGYATAFFQGSDQLTSGVGPLAQKLGFRQSYGKVEYHNLSEVETNSWGLFDTQLYEWVNEYAQTLPEPFFIGINTNTTHDFKLPVGVPWQFGDKNDMEKSHSVMAYADEELGAFLKKIQSQKFELPLTIVLVADHTSFTTGGYLNHYSIPFAMKGPGIKPQKLAGAYSQRDIAATLADLLGVSAPQFLGQSMLRTQDFTPGTELYHLGHSVWFVDSFAIDFNVRTPERYRCYDWRKDWNLTTEVDCPAKAEQYYQEALSYLIQTQVLLFQGKTF